MHSGVGPGAPHARIAPDDEDPPRQLSPSGAFNSSWRRTRGELAQKNKFLSQDRKLLATDYRTSRASEALPAAMNPEIIKYLREVGTPARASRADACIQRPHMESRMSPWI